MSGIYGLALGLRHMTRVRMPLLFLVTPAAALTGSIPEAIAMIVLFNLGRFLPMAARALPVNGHQTHAWLARDQKGAALADAAILMSLGAALAVAALA